MANVDAGISGGEVDSFSSVTDDIIVLILGRLPIDAAVRTSILSPRWRNLWMGLPDLIFCDAFNRRFGDLVNEVLIRRGNTSINRLVIWITNRRNLDINRVADWLSIARPLVTGELELSLPALGDEDDQIIINLPSFQQASVITLTAMDAGLRLPGTSKFLALKRLVLGGVRFTDAGLPPGHVVSWCCPELQFLEMNCVWGVQDLILSSSSLAEVRITQIHDLLLLDVTAVKLDTLLVYQCPYIANNPRSVSIDSSSLKNIHWEGPCPSRIRFKNKKLLDCLRVITHSSLLAQDCGLRCIGPCFTHITLLVLDFTIPRRSSEMERFWKSMGSMQDLDVSELEVSLSTNGHDCRRALYLLFQKLSSLRKLKLTFLHWVDDKPCDSACSCHKALISIDKKWPTLLQDICVINFTNTDDQKEFVKLISSGPSTRKLSLVCSSKFQSRELSSWVQSLHDNVQISFTDKVVGY